MVIFLSWWIIYIWFSIANVHHDHQKEMVILHGSSLTFHSHDIFWLKWPSYGNSRGLNHISFMTSAWWKSPPRSCSVPTRHCHCYSTWARPVDLDGPTKRQPAAGGTCTVATILSFKKLQHGFIHIWWGVDHIYIYHILKKKKNIIYIYICNTGGVY